MVNKRGLSPYEFEELDPDILEMLMIYDTYVEPSGTEIDMWFHSYNSMNQVLNNPNISPEHKKKLKPKDFDFLNILSDSSLTVRERIKAREKENEKASTNSIKAFGELIKKQALGKNNGK